MTIKSNRSEKQTSKNRESRQDTGSSRSEAAKKAAETRKERDPEAFSKMGQKGGSRSHGGKGSNA